MQRNMHRRNLKNNIFPPNNEILLIIISWLEGQVIVQLNTFAPKDLLESYYFVYFLVYSYF